MNTNEYPYYPTGYETMIAEVEAMDSIPAGSNPFHYDGYSMGTEIVRGITIMHPGYDREGDPRAMEWFYIYNKRTGQCIRINLIAQPTDEQVREQKLRRANHAK